MKYLLTGITGTLGQAVSKILLQNPENEIIGVSRDEQKQRALPKQDRLTLRLGDVRDLHRMCELSKNVDVIFHFAALKCIDGLESEIEECIKTNIDGTLNIVKAQRINSVPRVVLSSTDKAVSPINVYGHSKALAERLVLQNVNNVVCRYGNVVASRGSVVHAFKKTLKEETKIYLTHPDMTRFLISIEEAAKFVCDSSLNETGGLNIPKMKSCYVYEIAETIGSLIGVHAWDVEVTGLRPGEKIHEDITPMLSSKTSGKLTANELIDLIKPVL